ncbi:MAG: hypothetical protein C4313_10510 [Thermoflexus sp.]|uniref:type II toxin-antitoxin system RelE family toxin n=1 Tax=Thermoflexus sp. TaxID=1969742 RepID=UPI00331A5C0B
MTLLLTERAMRALEGLHPKHREQVMRRIDQLARMPRPSLTKIRHDRGELLSYRAGEYRIYVTWDAQTLRVEDIRKRNDAYR